MNMRLSYVVCLVFAVVTMQGATESNSSETVLSCQEVDVQPALPKAKKIWEELDYPMLYPRYSSPVVAILTVVVDRDGKVREPKLVETSEKEFGEEAVSKVKTWIVVPAQKDGKPVACSTVLRLKAEFTIHTKSGKVSRGASFIIPARPPTRGAR